MRVIFIFISLMLSFVCSYAQTAVKDTMQQVTLDPLEISAPAGGPAYQPSATKAWEIKHTRIALSFNYSEKTADAKEWITLRPYFYPTDSVVLDAKGMRIDSVLQVGAKGRVKLNYTYEDDQLTIRFGQVYKMTETVELYLKYTAMPYAVSSGGSSAIKDDRGLYFINTDYKVPHKPAQIWTQGETESNSHWMITIDKPNSRFTTQVELTVADSFTTLSNGALIKQIKGTKGMRTDVWKMDMPIQAYAVMLAVGKFSVVKNSWRNKEVSYYTEPEYEPFAYLMFNHTKDMMEYFSQRTGVPYPWNKYSQVVVRDYVSGAMENTSATLFGEFVNQNAREVADRNYEDIVSHELFHQWFGDYVTAESWSNVTLNESFANYGEQLWRAYRYGKASGDELAYNDLQVYLGYSSYNDPQLVRFHYDGREELFDPISYNKGGATLRYLNSLIGDAAFDKAMNVYLTRHALRSAEAHNWRQAVEDVTGQDWNWFFDQWYYHAGHPILKVGYNYDDAAQKLMVTVAQTQEDSTFVYQLPLKTAVIYGSNKTIIDWNIKTRKDTFFYDYKSGVRPVIIPDYTHVLPGVVKDGKKMPEWKVEFKQTDDYISKRMAVNAASKLLSDPSSQEIIDMAFADNIHPIRMFALAQIKSTQNDKYRDRWTDYVISMARYDSDKLVRAEAFNVLGEWKVEKARALMITAVNYSSYAIAGAALEALSRVDKDTAYVLAKYLLDKDPRASLETAIWTIIAKQGKDEDIVLFEQHAQYKFSTKKLSFANNLGRYLRAVKSDASFRSGAKVFGMLFLMESMKANRGFLSGLLFQVAADQKDNVKSDKAEEAEVAKRRMELLRPVLQKITDSENDADAAAEYKKKMKELFE